MDHILVIDDEYAVLDVVSKALTSSGYEVTSAQSAKEGIELFEKCRDFKLVITDISMPVINGNEVAKYIRSSDRPDTAIVALTGANDNQVNITLFNFLLKKPFKLELLLDVVRLLI